VLEALALCPGSLPVVGPACNTVAGAAGNVAGAGVSAGVGAVFSEAARWVASGAVWLIAQVGRAMSGTTSVDLGAGWFSAHEAVMASLAAAVVLPMACCAAIQLQSRYGTRAGSVVNNHRVKVFLSGIADPGTLEHASALIGETELRTWATTVDGYGSSSRTDSPTLRRLAPADALRRVPPGDAVVVSGHLPPIRLRLRVWQDDRCLRTRAGTGGAARADRAGEPGSWARRWGERRWWLR
jgi:hypothetical protein